jgi:hypothetical protein
VSAGGNAISAGVIGAAVLAVALFVGFFRDREWSELHLFVKHRPSLKFLFRAPRGEADPSALPGRQGYLSPEDEAEERVYVEFVEEHRGGRRSVPLPLW